MQTLGHPRVNEILVFALRSYSIPRTIPLVFKQKSEQYTLKRQQRVSVRRKAEFSLDLVTHILSPRNVLHSRFMSMWQVCHGNTSVDLHYSFHFQNSIFRQKKPQLLDYETPKFQNRFKITHVLQISCIYYRQISVAFLGKPLRSSGALDSMFTLISKASYNEIIYSKLSV